ncbi:MAG: M42 family peptidase, partial [Pseudothermotoga sp.]
MRENLIQELVNFCKVQGISGREERIRELLISSLPDGVEYQVDNLGNLIVEVGDGERSIALMAHMDEIGLVITGINSDGTLNFRKVGGFDDRLLLGAHLDVVTQNGVID